MTRLAAGVPGSGRRAEGLENDASCLGEVSLPKRVDSSHHEDSPRERQLTGAEAGGLPACGGEDRSPRGVRIAALVMQKSCRVRILNRGTRSREVRISAFVMKKTFRPADRSPTKGKCARRCPESSRWGGASSGARFVTSIVRLPSSFRYAMLVAAPIGSTRRRKRDDEDEAK